MTFLLRLEATFRSPQSDHVTNNLLILVLRAATAHAVHPPPDMSQGPIQQFLVLLWLSRT